VWWRRIVLTGCGLGLGAVPIGTAVADAPSDVGCPPRCTATLDGLPMPDLPVAHEWPRTVVRPGDSLWRIASSHLPDDADAADIADLVSRIHATNRAVLGPDPDLIFPGTHLTVPGGTP
jgi:hypothetical protein